MGLYTETTVRRIERADDPTKPETDSTPQPCTPYTVTGNLNPAAINGWVPPGGWKASAATNTKVCRREIAGLAAKIPEGLIASNPAPGAGGPMVSQLTCALPSKMAQNAAWQHRCNRGAHCLHHTHGYTGAAGTRVVVTAEPWSNTVKLSPERWAAIAASIPGFIMFYTNKAPATAAEFEATGAVGAQTPP